MKNKKIIALVGKMGSGKSTLAKEITDIYGGKIISFADPIRNMFEVLGVKAQGLTTAQKNEPLDRLSGRSLRYGMQTLGTDWARNMMNDAFWTNLWKIRVGTVDEELVITDDCRFLNEAEVVREIGGIIIRINRDTDQSRKESSHASETEMDSIVCDYEIDNNRSIGSSVEQILIKINRDEKWKN